MSGDTPAAPPGPTAPAPGCVPCVIPSFAAASELLSAPYSCLVVSSHRRHVVLPPVYLGKKKTGIKEELDAELLRFSHRLNGVMLAYDNIRVVGTRGSIYDDSGYIHMDIEANFILFQPKKGQKLLGKVNKLGASHVGCLVHSCFNASILRPNLISVETWANVRPGIGTDVEFEVTALDADVSGALLIRGRLSRTKVQELLAMGESLESSTPAEESEPTQESTQEPPDEPPSKKKKKKKDRIKEQEATEQITSPSHLDASTALEVNGTADEGNTAEAGEKKKKKKKKEKHLKEEEEESKVSRSEVHGSDSSGYLSDKPSKKRKRETETGSGSGLGEDESKRTKPKKKRKADV